MTITSTAFLYEENIPSEYTCDGANVNPPLTFSEVPSDAKSLVLIMDDPDASSGLFTHWLLYDMSPATLQVMENAVPANCKQGQNDFTQISYGGPCPQKGRHRYFFKLYALDTMLNLEEGASRKKLEEAMQGEVVLSTAELVGLYEKNEIETAESLTFGDNKDDYTDDRDTRDGQLITR